MKTDISYWLNLEAEKKKFPLVTINCAIEESTIGARAGCGNLLAHDIFIRDNITPADTVVVSLGGNDIALRPTFATIINMLSLVCCTTTNCINKQSCGTAIPIDDYCTGCVFYCHSLMLGYSNVSTE